MPLEPNYFPKVSLDKKLEIKLLGIEEPNNGRMLWRVEVFYQNKNTNDWIFNKNWNVFNFELDNWVLQDPKNRYYYLPIETNSVLIDIKTLNIHRLPYQGLSTIRFEGNRFEENFLIEKYNDLVVKTNLETLISIESKILK
ncbi:hypothetical protein ACE193_08555 [Bernardetia sp. OM2101]|uniref:hypothetical protein n=1 Tax=Bernardetia sp. OM2101 TaxID=3344876 RepID=UPI0035CF2A22